MAEIIGLDAEPPGKSIEPALEKALERARDGAYSAVAITVVYRDGSTGHLYSALPNRSAMIGALMRTAHELMKDD